MINFHLVNWVIGNWLHSFYLLLFSTPSNRYSISDIDECTTSPCHDNANCTNTAGGLICSCQDGYTGDGKTCRGIIKSIIN